MTYEAPSFGDAFDADLRTYEREQSEICELLSEGEPAPISTAAISNWKSRNRIPYGRLVKLAEIFGPDSQCAAYLKHFDSYGPGVVRASARPRSSSSTAGFQTTLNYASRLMEAAARHGVDPGEVIAEAGARVAKDLPPEVADGLLLISRLLRKVPPEKQERAVQMAAMVISEYL